MTAMSKILSKNLVKILALMLAPLEYSKVWHNVQLHLMDDTSKNMIKCHLPLININPLIALGFDYLSKHPSLHQQQHLQLH